jgi:hypothetical protein
MRLTFMTLCVFASIGCGDNGGGPTSTETSSGEPETTTTSGDPQTNGTSSSGDVAPTTGEPGSTSSGEPVVTSSSTGEPETSSSSGEPETGTTGDPLDCEAIVDGPLTPEKFVSGFEGSEDLAFDGKGQLALKRDGGVVLVKGDMSESVLTDSVPPAYGSRFMQDGRLLVALPQAGKVIHVDAMGTTGDFLPGTQGANGIYVDVAGAVWITEFGGSRVVRVGADMNKTTIVEGMLAKSANGVVFDPDRGILFYTNYQDGEIWRVAIDDQGVPATPSKVTEIANAAPDGLTLDACGYLYVVDQGNSTLYRVLLDEAGEATSEASELAQFPSNVANAQFGVGDGFDDHTLYVAGNPGDVYTLQVEFPGAPFAVVE